MIDDALEGAGVDPNRTPVDRLPEHAQWALASIPPWEGENTFPDSDTDSK